MHKWNSIDSMQPSTLLRLYIYLDSIKKLHKLKKLHTCTSISFFRHTERCPHASPDIGAAAEKLCERILRRVFNWLLGSNSWQLLLRSAARGLAALDLGGATRCCRNVYHAWYIIGSRHWGTWVIAYITLQSVRGKLAERLNNPSASPLSIVIINIISTYGTVFSLARLPSSCSLTKSSHLFQEDLGLAQ